MSRIPGTKRIQEVTEGHEEDSFRVQRNLRDPKDTRGHAIIRVRDREGPGSNPGPPTGLVSTAVSCARSKPIAFGPFAPA